MCKCRVHRVHQHLIVLIVYSISTNEILVTEYTMKNNQKQNTNSKANRTLLHFNSSKIGKYFPRL